VCARVCHTRREGHAAAEVEVPSCRTRAPPPEVGDPSCRTRWHHVALLVSRKKKYGLIDRFVPTFFRDIQNRLHSLRV